jgi:hypothetical protein
MKSYDIPNDWHSEYAYNCLSAEEFTLLQSRHDIGDDLYCDCQDCKTYILGKDHRCDCGSRRCYFQYNKDNNYFFISVD